jgi:5'-3' exonuclease
MGISSYYRTIVEKYLNIVSEFKKFNKPIKFYLDFNGLIHNAKGIVMKKYENIKNATPEIIEREMFNEISNYTTKLLKVVNPAFLMISIDGKVPRAKMVQQRLRRFKTAHDLNGKKPVFDGNSISPGTPFMYRLTEYLNNYIEQTLVKEMGIQVKFTDHTNTGEGEHTIINYIKQSNDYDDYEHIIYGLDADLIMLSLSVNKRGMYLLRERQFFEMTKDDKHADDNKLLLNYFDVHNFRVALWQEFNLDYNFKKFLSIEEFTTDYIFLCFFLGNDFVPHMKPLSVHHQGIEIMLKAYQNYMKKYKKSLVNKNLSIDIQFLRDIFKYISHREEEYIEFVNKKSRRKDYIIKYNKNNWKKRYYKHFFNDHSKEVLEDSCREYWQTIVWTFNYYFKKCVSYRFYYSYRAAPCLSDVCYYLLKNDLSFYFQKDIPYSHNQQLMMILPPQSRELINEKYRGLMEDELVEYFPNEFELEKVDKHANWAFTPILPNIDDNLILKYIKD